MRKLYVFLILMFIISGCSTGTGLLELADSGPPIPPPRYCTDSEFSTGTSETPCIPTPKQVADTYSGAAAEIVSATIGAAGDDDTDHGYAKEDIVEYLKQHDSDYDGLPDAVEADVLTIAMLADSEFSANVKAILGAADYAAIGDLLWSDLVAGDIPDLSGTYEVQLTNEAGLYTVLSDVDQFYEPGDTLQTGSDTSLPGTCTIGQMYIDTDADTNGSLYICVDTDTWKEVDDDGGAGGGGDLLADGTVPLTADWDAGSYEIRAETFESDVATGAAPFTVASTTVVTNLNADTVDGSSASDFESATSNDIDPDRLNGDTVDDDLIDQAIIAGLSSAGVATPGFTAYDSGNPGADKTAGDIYWNDDGTGADGSEDSDWFIRAMIGGTLSDILRYDNSDAQLEATVDLNLAEDLKVATGKHITVGANQLDNGSDKIDGAMIEDDGIDSPQYAAASIDNEHLADNAVGNDEMADDAVDSAEIADGSVDNVHLSNDAALPTVISGDPDSLDDTLATNPKLYRGGFIRYNAAGEATLDAFSVAGENVSIMFYPSVAIIVNPNASQTITRNGVALAEGEALINDSNYGLCVLTYLGTNSIDAQCSTDITQETE